MKNLKEAIILTASYYGFNLRPEVLLMYAEDLAGYDEQQVISAYKKYRIDPKSKFMPLPAQIIEILNPKISDDQIATDAASRTIEAVSKFGWNNPGFAKEYIGDLGWKAIDRFGGWQYVCENLGTEIQLTTFQAQVREISKSIIAKSKLGIADGPIEIPYRDKDILLNDKKREQALALVKNLSEKKGL